jgi:hypothetical protein
MAAARTLGKREHVEPGPAPAADEATFTVVEQALARRARGWKEKVQRDASDASDLDAQRFAFTASHMAPRSGGTPNQRSKESAPCSTSMVIPSIAL